MRGYNNKPLLEKDPDTIKPMRFHLLVKLLLEDFRASGVVIPDTAPKDKDDVSSTVGVIHSMGDLVENSESAEGVLHDGVEIVFDESISIDDPKRAFRWEGDTYCLIDVQTVLGILDTKPPPKRLPGDPTHVPEKIIAMFRDLVLIRPSKRRDILRESGIIVPEEVGVSQVGAVVSVGLGAFSSSGKRLPMDIKVNQKVWIPKHQNTELRIQRQDYFIVHQNKVLAVEEMACGK